MGLRQRLREHLAPETSPEPFLRYREGRPALEAFVAFALLLAPLGVALFAIADSEEPPLWIVPLAVGLPAFAFAFLLPRRRRRVVALVVMSLYVVAALVTLAFVVLFLMATCSADAYECPY